MISRRILIIALFFACAGPALSEPVVLPTDPPSTRTVPLQEVWRIGGDEDEDVLLGVVVHGVRDDAGRVYLLDNQLAQVLVLSPAGETIATVGREGEGPGEMRRPSLLFLTPEGRIGVVSRFPGKITLLNLDGTPGGEITFGEEATEGGFRSLQDAAAVGDRLVANSGRSVFDRDEGTSSVKQVLALFDLQGEELRRYEEFTFMRDFRNPVFDEPESHSPFRAWAADPAGKIYTTPERSAYWIKVADFEGNLLREMTRSFTPHKRSQEDKDRLVEGLRLFIGGRRVPIENRALDHDPAIMSLAAASDGRLFVVNCHQQPERLAPGVMGRFDVFSPAGEFTEELVLTLAGGDPRQDRLLFLDGRHFLVVFNFESARESQQAGLGDDEEDEEAALEEVEPLAVGFYVLGD